MKNTTAFFLLFFVFFFTNAQIKKAYKDGEKITYRIHYGLVNAGYATIEVNDTLINNKTIEHVNGKGWTVGMLRWVFPVKDNYQSFINTKTGLPVRAIRKLKEGGYTKNVELIFNHDSVLTLDHKHKKQKSVAAKNVQDMISAFYYLRNNVPEKLAVNDYVEIDMFFDHKKFPFKLIKLGEEKLETKFGNVNCLVFRPMVKSGRVFKAKESLTLWVTNDANRIPVRVKAELAVGSLKADIHDYKNLAHPTTFHKNP
ncbi:DUF3108 domain-containing protein [Ochrovirga pacifica]|uniref:DUF3108 domain-containing protein n=1 Tax=Ochrovirga pacifica TaxID=1042376 RepID=UPI000255950E|nr:DUF3108 domain-containing protein [Ochrovirga pacifica]